MSLQVPLPPPGVDGSSVAASPISTTRKRQTGRKSAMKRTAQIEPGWFGYTADDADLVRGCSATQLLATAGKHLRVKDASTVKGRTPSRQVCFIDTFVSHAWITDGRLKYLGLCLHINAVKAFILALGISLMLCLIGFPLWSQVAFSADPIQSYQQLRGGEYVLYMLCDHVPKWTYKIVAGFNASDEDFVTMAESMNEGEIPMPPVVGIFHFVGIPTFVVALLTIHLWEDLFRKLGLFGPVPDPAAKKLPESNVSQLSKVQQNERQGSSSEQILEGTVDNVGQDPLGTTYFLDKLCVEQGEEFTDKKKKAISLLGYFLFRSKNVLVLLDQKYLTRLWCVSELLHAFAFQADFGDTDLREVGTEVDTMSAGNGTTGLASPQVAAASQAKSSGPQRNEAILSTISGSEQLKNYISPQLDVDAIKLANQQTSENNLTQKRSNSPLRKSVEAIQRLSNGSSRHRLLRAGSGLGAKTSGAGTRVTILPMLFVKIMIVIFSITSFSLLVHIVGWIQMTVAPGISILPLLMELFYVFLCWGWGFLAGLNYAIERADIYEKVSEFSIDTANVFLEADREHVYGLMKKLYVIMSQRQLFNKEQQARQRAMQKRFAKSKGKGSSASKAASFVNLSSPKGISGKTPRTSRNAKSAIAKLVGGRKKQNTFEESVRGDESHRYNHSAALSASSRGQSKRMMSGRETAAVQLSVY